MGAIEATCNITEPPCGRPAVDRMRFINTNMDWHGDVLGRGFACRECAILLVDPMHAAVS